MTSLQIRSHTGESIRSFSDWEKYGLPPERREQHWKEGRSAFELARSWTAHGEPTVPLELVQLIDSHEATRRTVILGGITEHETALPFARHGPRCHDLSLHAEQDGRVVSICVEAKADESFGGTVAEELKKARKRRVTKFPERLDWFTRSLLGLPAFEDDQFSVLSKVVSELPYQLLSAIGGTLLEAKLQHASKAIFIVHEFRTTATADTKLEVNANALNRFLRLLLSANQRGDVGLEIGIGQLVGPISISERPIEAAVNILHQIPLFVGKVRTDRIGQAS